MDDDYIYWENQKRLMNEARYRQEYLGIPVSIPEDARLSEMHHQILRLQDQVKKYAWEKEGLAVQICDLITENKKLITENEELKIEVEKIHSRFDILEL